MTSESIKLPTYKKYKDSGVEWLGDVPSEWSLLANKHIFKLKKNLVGKRSKEYDLLSLTLKGIIKRDMENPEGKFPAEFDTYQEVKSGDFVFCLFDVEETPRTVGLSKYDGMITGAYTVFESQSHFFKEFLYYFYLNLDSKKRLKPLYRGLRNTIPKESFFSFKTFVPAFEVQTAIAEFLDEKTGKIDEAIAIKQKQIELLKERKQILIQNAVTRGLDPNVKLKDSKIDWIGQIPEHWEVLAMRRVLKNIEQGSSPSALNLPLKSDQASVIKISAVKKGEFYEEKAKPIEEKHYEERYQIHKDDLLITRGNTPELVADSCVVRNEPKGRLIMSDLVYRLKPNSLTNHYYLCYLLLSSVGRHQIQCDARGSSMTMAKVSQSHIKNWLTTLPPKNEQKEIVNFIKGESLKMKQAVDLQQQQIEKLKEYKSTLINSAVTGKIKLV